MKLALFFLSCFVGFSYQERYIWPMPYAPRAHLMPLFYADGQPAEVETAPVIQVNYNCFQSLQEMFSILIEFDSNRNLIVSQRMTQQLFKTKNKDN